MASDLATQVKELHWYHTMDLPGGVRTSGMFDLRHCVGQLPLPASLAGRRCLDIGTCDGFWAFELERRGADEVVAIDLADPNRRDLTPGVRSGEGSTTRAMRTFALAHEAIGSQVQWKDLSVYDLSPDEVGEFDFVFMGSLLQHLQNPIAALRAIRTVARGEFLSYDSISLPLTLLSPRKPAAELNGRIRQEWWLPNKAARVREVEAAGFDIIETGPISWVKYPQVQVNFKSWRRRPFLSTMLKVKGAPHTWIRARRPASS